MALAMQGDMFRGRFIISVKAQVGVFLLTCPLLIGHIATAMLPLPNEQFKHQPVLSHMLLNNLLTFVAGKFGVPRPCRDAADFAVGGAWKSCYGGDAFG